MMILKKTRRNSGLRQMESASSVRRSLERSLRSYLNMLTALKEVPDWQDAYAEINELVKAAKNSAVARKKNNEEPE
ncbi:hypothetical protein LPB90_17690 [Chryseobacterium sp. LC2016-29]|uniref:hypothetical protein n=1 Tax=Chryseobacterium sp. LC2016-29 TaxID=2897331 RepID=UPI001E4C3132|nr:hypothetical protein [Chryseobacterium sp. LC2016-29]MCD0480272.1 hypothetical protein [Chryseobacterium sp. LC2016-29]